MKMKFTVFTFLIILGLGSFTFSQDTVLFADDFSGTLSAWIDENGNDWTILNNQLHGYWSLSNATGPQADLILKDENQPPANSNWKASIDFTNVADDGIPIYHQAIVEFSLWQDANLKFIIDVGGAGDNWGGIQDSIGFRVQAWNGSWGQLCPVSAGKVKFHWDAEQWHTASIVKYNNSNIYSVLVDNACIAHYIDTILNGQGKIGLHSYGTKKHDNFKLISIVCQDNFTDQFTGNNGTIPSSWNIEAGEWTIQNNQLHGYWSLSNATSSQADMILKDIYQPASSSNWKASVDFTNVSDDGIPIYHQAMVEFALWQDANMKFIIDIGGAGDNWGGIQDSIGLRVQAWNGSWGQLCPVSIGKVKFHWDAESWHTAKLEKRNNIYSVFVDNAAIGHYIDTLLYGQGKIGLHSYGTKKHDNFLLQWCTDLLVGIEQNQLTQDQNLIVIYPNPANNKLYISMKSIHPPLNLEILNMQGQLLQKQVLKNSLNAIDISNIPCGVFLIKIVTEDGISVKKLIKQ